MVTVAPWCAVGAAPVAAQSPPPTDFDLRSEPGRPFIHYLENADQLAEHLLWYAEGADGKVAAALDAEITAFDATYGPRPGISRIEAGPTPGLSKLKAAYDALADHFARYRGRDVAEPLPEALASMLRSDALVAQKRIRKVRTRREAARGIWPTCRGVPLGSLDTQCSTDGL